MDHALFRFINNIPRCMPVDILVFSLDHLGRERVLMEIIGVFFFAGIFLKRKTWWQGSLFLGAAVLTAIATSELLKTIICRPRPFVSLSDVRVLAYTGSYSFPSGHAARYAAIGTFMAVTTDKLRWVWLLIPLAAGVGRIYQGVHYPSDVLAGWAIGVITGWSVAMALRRTNRTWNIRGISS